MENSSEVSLKMDVFIVTPEIQSRYVSNRNLFIKHQKSCTRMFIVELFVTVANLKLPKLPLAVNG